MGRILYDIELSFFKNKFFLVVRRRVSRQYHQEHKNDDGDNVDLKKESK